MYSKKVLLVNDFLTKYGGAEVIFENYYNVLLKNKFDVRLFTSENSKTSVFNYIYNWKVKNDLYKLLVEFNPDIIHIHNFYHKLSPSIFLSIKKYRKKNDFKLVGTWHDFYFLAPNSNLLYFDWKGHIKIIKNFSVFSYLFKKIDMRGVKYDLAKKFQWIYAQYIICFSRYYDKILVPSRFASDIIKNSNLPVEVLYNPIDVDAKDIALDKKRKGSNEILKFLFVGRLSREKGLFEFIKNLKTLQLKNYCFRIIGGGPEDHRLRKLVGSENLTNNVTFLGKLPYNEVLEIMEEQNALILPSLSYETAGNVIIEAALKGLYLFVSSFGGQMEISNICGGVYLFNPYDNNSFKESLEKWLDDECYKNPPKRNIDNIQKLFSIQGFEENLLSIYRKL